MVCEGQLDLIACYMAGVQNVVAPQGTAFTADHARILKRYVEEVVLCFDSDAAGQNAAVRSLDHLLASGLAVRVAVVPAPEDPDSFIKTRGGAEFKKLIQQAAGFYDYYLDRLCAENDNTTDRGRLTILRAMAAAVHKSGNVVLIDKYAQKTALRLGVAPDAVRLEFGKSTAQRTRAAERPAESVGEAPVVVRPSITESWLLKVLLTQEDLVEWAAKYLDPAWIEHGLVRQLVEQRLAEYRKQTWTNLANFLAQCASPDAQALVTESATDDRPLPNPAQQLRDIAFKLRNQFFSRQIAVLMQQAGQPNVVEEQKLELLRQIQDLRLLRSKPMEG